MRIVNLSGLGSLRRLSLTFGEIEVGNAFKVGKAFYIKLAPANSSSSVQYAAGSPVPNAVWLKGKDVYGVNAKGKFAVFTDSTPVERVWGFEEIA